MASVSNNVSETQSTCFLWWMANPTTRFPVLVAGIMAGAHDFATSTFRSRIFGMTTSICSSTQSEIRSRVMSWFTSFTRPVSAIWGTGTSTLCSIVYSGARFCSLTSSWKTVFSFSHFSSYQLCLDLRLVGLVIISSSVCSENHCYLSPKLFVQLPSELTLISLVALLALGDREGFGVGNGLRVGVPLLRLSLSLVFCFSPLPWF